DEFVTEKTATDSLAYYDIIYLHLYKDAVKNIFTGYKTAPLRLWVKIGSQRRNGAVRNFNGPP
ncbi:MAG TPA: hypothetical protein VGE25_05360, partial [Sediminibacterium sp.]